MCEKDICSNKNSYSFFLKLFVIPSVIWLILSIFTKIYNESESDPITWGDIIIADIVLLIVWLIIVIAISLIVNLFNKTHKFESKDGKSKLTFIYIYIIISFILCTVLRFSLIIENYLKSFIITLLFFIPTLISVFLLILNKKRIVKVKTIKLIQILILIPSIIYISIVLFTSFLIEATDGVEKIINYKRVYNYYKFEFFPKEIPNNTKNIIFHYNPSVFQGGEIFSLYFKCDKKIISSYEKKYKKYKLEKNSAKRKDIEQYNNSFTLFTPYKKKNINEFTIYLLDKKCDKSKYCNHGMYKLIAINKSTNEIILYYEKW